MAEEKDDLTSLFESINSEILDDDMKLKIGTLFESMVNEAVELKEKELDEKNEEEIKSFKEQLVEQTDDYLDYFIQGYIKENEVVVEDFAKVKLAEKVLRNFSQMVEAFNMSLSEESIQDDEEIETLKTESNKLHNQLIEAKKETAQVKKAAIISSLCIGVTDLELVKITEASKTIEFDTEELFEAKLQTLKEKIISEGQEQTSTEKLEEELEVPVDPKKKIISEEMQGYLKHFKKK